MTMQKLDYPGTGDVLFSGTAKNGLRIRVLPKKGFSGFYAVFATDYGGTYRRFTLDGVAYAPVWPIIWSIRCSICRTETML